MRSLKLNRYNRNGDKHGLWEHYFENGNLYSIGLYKNGEEEGYWEYYYDNGQLHSKLFNQNGIFLWKVE